jgi:hypothetical protein
VLVLDEAITALDGETEKGVMAEVIRPGARPTDAA